MEDLSVSVGSHFEHFIRIKVSNGKYKNANEVIRAGLQLLENEEGKVIALKNAIQEWLDNPKIENFDFDNHLTKLKIKGT